MVKNKNFTINFKKKLGGGGTAHLALMSERP